MSSTEIAWAVKRNSPETGVGVADAGDRAAVLYSLLGSCRRYGHNPHDYLKDVLTRLPTMSNQDDLRPLLPSHWQPPTTS